MKIREKILLPYITLIFPIILILSIMLISLLQENMLESLRDKAYVISNTVSRIVDIPLVVGDYAKIQEILVELKKSDRDIVYAIVTDDTGRGLASTEAAFLQHQFVHTEHDRYILSELDEFMLGNIRYEGERLYESVRIIYSESRYYVENEVQVRREKIGILRIALTFRNFANVINTAIIFSVVILVSSIVYSLFLFFQTKRINKNLNTVLHGMSQYSKGILGEQIRLDSHDEITSLAQGFNSMGENLKIAFEKMEVQNQKIREYSERLEDMVEDRTLELNKANDQLNRSNVFMMRTNERLSSTLQKLKETQDQLLIQEKMASLGNLVAGVSHEINTPIGVGITAASFLQDITKQLKSMYENEELSEEELMEYIQRSDQSADMILLNLRRAADLIQSFKQVAVDQSTSSRRQFDLKEYIDEVLLSLQPKLKKTKHLVKNLCPNKLVLDSYPGAFSQIISNFILNSLSHGFDDGDKGEILFFAEEIADRKLKFVYQDNGKGISEEHLLKIFDPFFTTKRGSGGTGLGLQIVYNLVTQQLQGKIECRSQAGKGTEFIIIVPLTDKSKQSEE